MKRYTEIETKLDILLGSGTISGEVVEFCHQVMQTVQSEAIVRDEYAYEMMITHLAMASQRMLDKDFSVTDDNADLLEDIRNEDCFESAVKLSRTIFTNSIIWFTQAEINLMILHLCNVIS